VRQRESTARAVKQSRITLRTEEKAQNLAEEKGTGQNLERIPPWSKGESKGSTGKHNLSLTGRFLFRNGGCTNEKETDRRASAKNSFTANNNFTVPETAWPVGQNRAFSCLKEA